MGAITIERGDTILTKEGKTIRVLSVYYNGEALSKIEGVDDSENCPMRRPVFSAQIARVMKKAAPPEPKVEDPASTSDVSRETPKKKGDK